MLMEQVASSNITEIGYDDTIETLVVRFASGATYAYLQVPREVYLSLWEAESIGSYFYHNVRSKYQCVRK